MPENNLTKQELDYLLFVVHNDIETLNQMDDTESLLDSESAKRLWVKLKRMSNE